MRLLIELAWRNLWRNPRRTFLTTLAITISATVLVFCISLQLSSYDAGINAVVDTFYGHLQIQKEGYQDKPQIRTSLDKILALQKQVNSLELVEESSTRAYGFALISSKERTFGAQIVGVQKDNEKLLSNLPKQVKEGNYFADDELYQAVIGKTLAKNLKIKLNDEISVLGQARDGSLVALVLVVSGIFESGEKTLDRSLVQIPLQTFQLEFAMEEHGHSIIVKTKNLNQVSKLQKEVKKYLKQNQTEAVALRWDELVPGLKNAIELDMVAGWLFFGSLVVVVAFMILNTLLMSVIERTKEFGVLLAIGVKPKNLAIIVFLENILLNSLGIAFGIILGSLIIFYFGQVGFSVPGSEEVVKEWNFPAIVYTRVSLYSLSIGPIVIFISSLFASFYPLLKILKLEPLPAMKATE